MQAAGGQIGDGNTPQKGHCAEPNKRQKKKEKKLNTHGVVCKVGNQNSIQMLDMKSDNV